MKKLLSLSAIGFLLYLILGAVLPFVSQPKISEETVSTVDATMFVDTDTGPERERILSDNVQALEKRIRLISQAKDRIVLSTFDFRADESGKDTLSALCAAADRGVTVEVLVDGFPALLYLGNSPYFQALSAMERAWIRIYNPIPLIKPWRLMGGLHDKYLLVDNQTYILGGRNTYDYFLGEYSKHKNYDWDVLVWCSDTRKASSVNQLMDCFSRMWSSGLCRLYHDDRSELDDPDVKEAKNELYTRYQNLTSEHPDWFVSCDYKSVTAPTNQIQFVSNPTHCGIKEPVVFYTVTQLMQQAQTEVRPHPLYDLR